MKRLLITKNVLLPSLGGFLALVILLGVILSQSSTKAQVAPTPEPSLLAQINQVRAKVNKPPLMEASLLDQAAHLKDDDLVARHYRWHYYPGEDATTAWKFLHQIEPGFGPAAENLAWCQTSDTQRVHDWISSPAHYAAMIGDYSQWGTYTEVDPTDGCQITVNYFLR